MLGVDGGQSAIRVRHSSATAMVELAGISHQDGATAASIVAIVAEGWRAGGALPVDRAVLGLTTAPPDEPERDSVCGRVAAAIDAPEVWLADDAVTATPERSRSAGA